MAAEIAKQTSFEPELISGSGGVFDVVADGKTIFSKHEQKRFPEHEEVLKQLTS